jgi:hypothetical protein
VKRQWSFLGESMMRYLLTFAGGGGGLVVLGDGGGGGGVVVFCQKVSDGSLDKLADSCSV